MPWEGVTVSEQRQSFIRDYVDGRYSRTELAERFSISRKTAYKWINRFKGEGLKGVEERSRRPRSCPWQTDKRIVEDLVAMRKAKPSRGPKKLLDKLRKRHRYIELPALSAVAHPRDVLEQSTPQELYYRSARTYNGRSEPWHHPDGIVVKYVCKNGAMRRGAGKWVMVSTTLIGKYVGLEQIEEG